MVDKYTKMFNREKVSLRAMDDFVLDAAFAPTLVLGGGTSQKTLRKQRVRKSPLVFFPNRDFSMGYSRFK